ncbi:hypothetical protein L7F22_063950 [Adiantum nelumboides]|nr:hypothetical protein [Adiantum nelumboides]
MLATCLILNFCLSVGNIPYDATEEELTCICEEVGPVISFRLVIDRDTGKMKFYGFCEYRDEETPLSARCNLQGYDINGRQLRVDFAENEKGSADRYRDDVKTRRAGPHLSNQSGGPKRGRDAALFQPVGLHAAVSAAAVMASLLGATQVSAGNISQLGVTRPPPGIDALTILLAGMSKYQLFDVLNHMKARQVLMSNSQLVKALFQAQIILGSVPQVNLQPQGLQQGSILPVQQGQVQQAPNNPQLQQGLQHAQAQRSRNYPFLMPAPTQQQMSNRAGPTMMSQQPLPPLSSLGLPPLNLTMQRTQPQLPLHLNPPPLPQQIRPMLSPSPPQVLRFQAYSLLSVSWQTFPRSRCACMHVCVCFSFSLQILIHDSIRSPKLDDNTRRGQICQQKRGKAIQLTSQDTIKVNVTGHHTNQKGYQNLCQGQVSQRG